jgi:hypothetical protein
VKLMTTEREQPNAADPGLITLVTALRFNGIGADPHQIRHRLGGVLIGIPEMLRVAKELGLSGTRCPPSPRSRMVDTSCSARSARTRRSFRA